jgi:hypothetical protein
MILLKKRLVKLIVAEPNERIWNWPYCIDQKMFMPPSVAYWQYLDTEYVGELADVLLMRIIWKS